MSLGGGVCGFVYGVIQLILVAINLPSLSDMEFGIVVGLLLGMIVSGSILGMISALFSYKLLNRVLKGDYFTIMASIEEQI